MLRNRVVTMMMYGSLGCPSQTVPAVVFKAYFLSANADMVAPPSAGAPVDEVSENVRNGTRASVLRVFDR